MYIYNATSKNLANNWRNATYNQKHAQVQDMLLTVETTNDQEIEYATRDFMDRWVYGSNMSVDCSSLKCERGFSYYNVNRKNTPKRKKLNIDMNEVRKIELQRVDTLNLLGYKKLAEYELSKIN